MAWLPLIRISEVGRARGAGRGRRIFSAMLPWGRRIAPGQGRRARMPEREGSRVGLSGHDVGAEIENSTREGAMPVVACLMRIGGVGTSRDRIRRRSLRLRFQSGGSDSPTRSERSRARGMPSVGGCPDWDGYDHIPAEKPGGQFEGLRCDVTVSFAQGRGSSVRSLRSPRRVPRVSVATRRRLQCVRLTRLG